MKKQFTSLVSVLTLLLVLMSGNVLAASPVSQATETVGVRYKTHIQDKGWETAWKADGELSGTVGESKRLEAIKVELTGDVPEDANIETWVHVQNEGDKGPFIMGEAAGSEGKSQRLERITLQLNNMPGYSLRYNVQVQNKGWLMDEDDSTTWFVDGEAAGTEGESLRLEAIKIIITKDADLTDYQEALDSVSEENYTEESWTVYQDVVEANTVTKLNTQEEVYVATISILKAQKNLVSKSDLTAYEAALAAVTEDQVKEGWTAYQAVVDANVMTAQNTQEEVDTATANILAAQKDLVFYSDLTAFNDAIQLYVLYGADSTYTPYSIDTWDAYVAVCEEYGSLSDGEWEYDVISKESSQEVVDDATEVIEAVWLELESAADLSAFSAAKNIEQGNYTTASFEAYQADSRVIAIVEVPTATMKGYSQGVVDGYTATLLALQEEILVYGADLSQYEMALAAVEESDFTSASWTIYQAVVDENVVSVDNTQAQVSTATANIIAAQTDLVYKASYVVSHAGMTGSEFGELTVGDNILTIANEFIEAAGIDSADYTVTFIRVDSGSTVINEETGEITSVGDVGTTVYFTITPNDGGAAANTINIGLEIA
ncbi:hypothetical protein Q5O24_11355 [Eubacteriaceae bacterium ES3]|nr:hypothetical protein Q5O24_11355 [Eubacteriaceae bacterium ES3]